MSIGNVSFIQVGRALGQIRDRRLYRNIETDSDKRDLIGLECIIALGGHPKDDSLKRAALITPESMIEAERILSSPEWVQPVTTQEIEKSPKPSGVYFIQAVGTPFVKIGFSIGRDERISNLQIGCPYELKLIGWIEGDFIQESQLHEKFSHLHERGEWFRLTDELSEFIEGVKIK